LLSVILLNLASSLDTLCLEEFVAHASAVNCLKIGRKSSRVLVTGGEDHKVNLWAIGKPNAILVRSFSSPFLIFLNFHPKLLLLAVFLVSLCWNNKN
jgi:WD40 repeat protein